MSTKRGGSRLPLLLGISAAVGLTVVVLTVVRLRESPTAPAGGRQKSEDTTPPGPEPILSPTPNVPAPIADRSPSHSGASAEAIVLSQIRDAVKSNPTSALALAREARVRFGDSPESDERDKLLVDALINLQKIGAARDETGYYYKHHPDGRFGQYLWTMTGARPDPASGSGSGSGPRR